MSALPRKALAVFLALALLCPAAFASAFAAAPDVPLWGDADGNGHVNGADLILLRRHLAARNAETGTSPVPVAPGADADGSGDVALRDLLLLRRYAADYDYALGASAVRLGPGTGAPLALRIGTYNIKNGKTVAYDYSLIADDIVGIGLDICGLQEVDINTRRNGRIDTAALLAELTGYGYCAFAHAIDYSGGEYGTAVLSRFPIVHFEVILLPSAGFEQRACGHAVIDVNGTLIDFFNTHLSYENSSVRAEQFAALSGLIGENGRWVLTADFNTEDFAEFDALGNVRLVNDAENRLSSFDGSSAIDNIVLPADAAVLRRGVLDTVTHSDHCMVWADVALP